MAQRITELYAWICDEPDGGQGVPAHAVSIKGPEFQAPTVGADRERIESLRGFAELTAKKTGMLVRLVRFYEKEILEEIDRRN